MNKFLAFFSLIIASFITISIAFAADFNCASFYKKPSNVLGGVTVFNADYLGDKHTAELAPGSEFTQGNTIIQFWDLNAYRDTKLFVSCIYEDNNTVTKLIPDTVNVCQLKFIDNFKVHNSAIKPSFECYKGK